MKSIKENGAEEQFYKTEENITKREEETITRIAEIIYHTLREDYKTIGKKDVFGNHMSIFLKLVQHDELYAYTMVCTLLDDLGFRSLLSLLISMCRGSDECRESFNRHFTSEFCNDLLYLEDVHDCNWQERRLDEMDPYGRCDAEDELYAECDEDE